MSTGLLTWVLKVKPSRLMTDPYSQRAQHFFNQYQQLAFEDVHQNWLHHLPDTPGYALDVGAGSGRDATALAKRGWGVVAVEPAAGLRQLGEEATKGLAVQWIDDRLPELKEVSTLGYRFNLILVSAVWMHLPPIQRSEAFSKILELTSPGGIIVITLRHGPGDGERTFHETRRSELEGLAHEKALTALPTEESPQNDQLGRDKVWWETVVFKTPTTEAQHEPA